MLRKRWGSRLNAAALATLVIVALAPCIVRAEEVPIASGTRTNGKGHVDILSLKRTEGDTLTLRIAVSNDGNRSLDINLGLARLIDLVGRRYYFPGLTSPRCEAASGERTICWAIYAAPNPGIKSVNVIFDEDFGLIPVPIGN